MSTSNLKRSVLLPRDQVQNPGSLLGRLATRLGPNELRRRIWHMSPGLLPFILWAIPHADPMSPTLRVILILASLGLGIGIFAKYRQIQREEDHGRLMSVIGYAGSVLAMLMLFPADLELGLTLLAILAFGDGAATFFGRFIQGRKLPWNREKTWSGFLGFLCVGTPMAAIIFWGETHNLEAQTPGVSFPTAFLYASVATFTAAVAESLPSRINDNIRVGLTAAVSLVVIHLGIVGW